MKNSAVLYLASRPFLPASSGREKMIKQSVDFLLESSYVDLIIFAGRREVVDEGVYLKMGCRSVSVLRLNGFMGLLANLVSTKKLSAQEALYFSGENVKLINTICAGAAPCVVVADMQRTGVFLPHINVARKILDLDDLLSRRYEQMINRNSNESILGAFSDRLPRVFSSLLNKFGNWVLSREARLLRDAELSAAKKYDAVLLTSQIEVKHLRSVVGADNIFSNCPAIDALERPVAVSQPNAEGKSISALFVGNFKTAQNIASMQYICDCIIPGVKALGYSLKISAVGFADSAAKNRFKDYPVNFLGFVDDLPAVAAGCSIALLPVPFGTGIKTKVLDCMAMGLPVFTNDVGVEGIDAIRGEELFVFDDNEMLCEAIVSAVVEFNEFRCVGKNGYAFVNRVHRRDVVSERLRTAVFGVDFAERFERMDNFRCP